LMALNSSYRVSKSRILIAGWQLHCYV